MKHPSPIAFLLLTLLTTLRLVNDAQAELQVGAAIVDVTPGEFPVLVNGGMTSRSADSVSTPVNARVIVLDDGEDRIGIAVVDSCMMPRPLLDDAKALAAQRTGLKPDKILISATHTHTAPSCMGALGTDADPAYVAFLREKLAQSFVEAEKHLEPANVGWGSIHAPKFTALRRWIRRPDRLDLDPFGNPTVRANMHSARNLDDVTGESGPEDPELGIIAFQSLDGRPIALLANFSMHYFGGVPALSSDYFGQFCDRIQSDIGHKQDDHPQFVAVMSHGCSGDIWRRDYRDPASVKGDDFTLETFVSGLAEKTFEAYEKIEYQSGADLEMAESRMEFKYRVPDQQRLEWSQRIVAEMGDRLPKTQAEIYAREQVLLHERQQTEIVVQALRIGEIAIATTPNETYALTGLKLKLQSPIKNTMVIELANGGDGYIPPPEQHMLGGYNTWAARSAGLEVTAEPKIVAAALNLLEKVAQKPRSKHEQSIGRTAQVILNHKPIAYWRFDEFAGPVAVDHSGNNQLAFYENPIAYFLEGPSGFCESPETNRCVHIAGGHVRSHFAQLGDEYSVSMWIWNGLPTDARPITGWMFSRGHEFGGNLAGDHLGLGGVDNQPGKLVFSDGDQTFAGQSEVGRWEWNHVLLTRHGESVKVYLNGKLDIEANTSAGTIPGVFIGGRCDGADSWEGRLDEVAVFDRALTGEEVSSLK